MWAGSNRDGNRVRDDLLSRIIAISKDHNLQRIQLELTLETTPRDSRYSSGLVDLMKREEVISRDGTLQQASELYRRVDEALSLETHRFFARTSSQNIKRWQSLHQKLERERERLKNDIMARLGRRDGNISGSKVDKRALSPEDLDFEELRLEEEYNRNFLKHEGFSLREAFSSQAARVDKDWSVHEEQLAEDYQNRRRSIIGTRDVSPQVSSPSRDYQQDGRWQHPEKQKTLIHTAPVLAPTTTVGGASASAALSASGGRGSSSSGKNGKGGRVSVDPSTNKELEKLEKQYASAVESLEKQKAGAMRWMARQQVRLTAQVEEVQAERAVIGEIMSRQIHELKLLRDAVVTVTMPSQSQP